MNEKLYCEMSRRERFEEFIRIICDKLKLSYLKICKSKEGKNEQREKNFGR